MKVVVSGMKGEEDVRKDGDIGRLSMNLTPIANTMRKLLRSRCEQCDMSTC